MGEAIDELPVAEELPDGQLPESVDDVTLYAEYRRITADQAALRRLAMLVDPALSGLPAFLTPSAGLNSGFMIPQVTAAALVAVIPALWFPRFDTASGRPRRKALPVRGEPASDAEIAAPSGPATAHHARRGYQPLPASTGSRCRTPESSICFSGGRPATRRCRNNALSS